jgi:hypothetical protein
MENEALVLRARAELARIEADYAQNDSDRLVLAERARAFEAQAQQIEDSFERWGPFPERVHELAR